MELGAIAIAEGLAGFDRNPRRVEFDFAHPAQCLRQNVAFEEQLRIVARMLILASAATAKNRARGLDAGRRRLGNAQQPGALRVLTSLGALDVDGLPGKHKRREDDLAIQAAQSLASKYQLFDAESEIRIPGTLTSILSKPLCRVGIQSANFGPSFSRDGLTMRAPGVWLSLLTGIWQ